MRTAVMVINQFMIQMGGREGQNINERRKKVDNKTLSSKLEVRSENWSVGKRSVNSYTLLGWTLMSTRF